MVERKALGFSESPPVEKIAPVLSPFYLREVTNCLYPESFYLEVTYIFIAWIIVTFELTCRNYVEAFKSRKWIKTRAH